MTFIAWLLNLLAGIGIKFWQARGPSPVVVEAEKAGSATEAVAAANQAVVTQAAIATAEAEAPKTKADVIGALNKGNF